MCIRKIVPVLALLYVVLAVPAQAQEPSERRRPSLLAQNLSLGFL